MNIDWAVDLVYGCPIDGCDWAPPVQVLRHPTDEDVDAADAARVVDITTHAETTHTVRECLATIAALHEQLDELREELAGSTINERREAAGLPPIHLHVEAASDVEDFVQRIRARVEQRVPDHRQWYVSEFVIDCDAELFWSVVTDAIREGWKS